VLAPVKQIAAGVLDVGYADAGSADGPAVVLLHGSPDPSSYTDKFSGTHSHRTITGGIGHNLPQEAPEAFADAILEVGAAR
jgi:pimeloyl-ACP methyl ester carboxylesterase